MLETLVGVKESVVHNGYAYRSLARHDPHSQKVIPEHGNFYSFDPPWELCPDTSDARHVCAAYPWATRALVFADGSACWTKNTTAFAADSIRSQTNLKQKEGNYGVDNIVFFNDAMARDVGYSYYNAYVTSSAHADGLLRRLLPY
jgi:hypothetical protein